MRFMLSEHYVWFVWATAFLVPWLLLYIAFPAGRRAMLGASLFTTPLGLTEPLFVPSYWHPPSLFDLGAHTGFDLESLVFCFGIGGVGAVFCNALAPAQGAAQPQGHPPCRYFPLALGTPLLSFPVLYLLPWNPIYAAITALLLGTSAIITCQPGLAARAWSNGALFVGYYWIFIAGLAWLSPGYIQHVWNLKALSGISVLGMPIEEILFAAAFGMCWSGVYEYYTPSCPTRVFESGDRGLRPSSNQ